MKKELFLVKKEHGAIPIDDESREIYSNFKYGDMFRADHWKERNIIQHRKMFLLAQIVTNNNSKWPDPYHFVKTCQMDVKSVDIVRKLTGEIVEYPKSLKFNNMGEVEFRKLFSDIANLMLAHLNVLLPGMSEEDFRDKVQMILDMCWF